MRRSLRLLFVFFLLATGAWAAQSVRVEIPAVLYMADEAFPLGEAARITGPARAQDALSPLVLSSFGGVLSREEVLRAIQGSGLDDARVELRMPARVRVEVPGLVGNETETPAERPTNQNALSKSSLSLAIKALAAWDGEVDVSFKGPVPPGKLVEPASIVPGTPAATLRFRDDRGRMRSLAVRLTWSQKVLVAARTIQKDTLIRPQDLMARAMRISQPGVYATKEAEVLGHILRRAVKQGETIPLALLSGSDLVKKGRKVRIVARHGGLTASAEGVLLEDGTPGDTVRVRRADNKKVVLKAVIVDENTVEVKVQ